MTVPTTKTGNRGEPTDQNAESTKSTAVVIKQTASTRHCSARTDSGPPRRTTLYTKNAALWQMPMTPMISMMVPNHSGPTAGSLRTRLTSASTGNQPHPMPTQRNAT